VAAVKLVGFIVLLAVIFVCAHVIGGRVGPVTTGHSQIQYTGGMNMGGMNMGAQP
jgi:hypothetical protein